MTALRTSNAPIGLSRGKPISTDNNPPAWFRPSDWLTYTVPTASEQKVIGIVAVWNQDSNYMAVNVTITDGTQYTVDWGDGTTSDHNSGTTAEKNYSWSSISSGTVTSLGYRQAIVTITPKTAGKTFSQLQLSRAHSSITANTNTTSPWLDVSVSAPNATALDFGMSQGNITTNRINASLIENLNIVSYGGPNCAYLCNNMYSLQNVKINISGGNASSVTNMFQGCISLRVAPLFSFTGSPIGMFLNCYSLQSVPLYNLSGMTSMQNMFSGCSMLETVPLFDTSAVTTWSSAFNACYSLKEIPPFNTSAAQNFSNTFSNCFSITTFPQISTTVLLSNTSNMFNACKSLKTIPLFNTSGVTNASGMFTSCESLENVPSFNFSSTTQLSTTFLNCYALQIVPAFTTGISLTNVQNMFSSCRSLIQIPDIDLTYISTIGNSSLGLGSATITSATASLGRAKITGNKWTQSFQNCLMGATELNEMYTSLATLNPSITNISGNGTTVTVTVGTSFIRPFVTGRSVTISGVNPVAYNISGTVASVNTGAGTFTINNAATGAYVSGGTASITSDRTITVTGNPGTATDNPTIATNKGWTVTG